MEIPELYIAHLVRLTFAKRSKSEMAIDVACTNSIYGYLNKRFMYILYVSGKYIILLITQFCIGVRI